MDASPDHLPLLPGKSRLALRRIQREEGAIVIVAAVTGDSAPCPTCGMASHHIHSRYPRTLHDLPWQGCLVRLRLGARRFYCRSPGCPCKIFTERIPEEAVPYGRQTGRLMELLQVIGYSVGGEAGWRLAQRIGIESSAVTILRKLKHSASLDSEPIRRSVLMTGHGAKGTSTETLWSILNAISQLICCRIAKRKHSEDGWKPILASKSLAAIVRAPLRKVRERAPRRPCRWRTDFTASVISHKRSSACWNVWLELCGRFGFRKQMTRKPARHLWTRPAVATGHRREKRYHDARETGSRLTKRVSASETKPRATRPEKGPIRGRCRRCPKRAQPSRHRA
jgi:hypothetical protein